MKGHGQSPRASWKKVRWLPRAVSSRRRLASHFPDCWIPLCKIRQRGSKRVIAFAVERDVDVQSERSNTFEIESCRRKADERKAFLTRRVVRPAIRPCKASRGPAPTARSARRTRCPTWKECAMTDPFDLQRFLDAQTPTYARVLAELGRRQKQSHWMWFIFPQIAGLGYSAMAQRFAIASREEAAAYLGHSILGPRLKECTALVSAVGGRAIREILGSPDDLKFKSSMTLFSADSSDPEFPAAIAKFYDGKLDQRTLELLELKRT